MVSCEQLTSYCRGSLVSTSLQAQMTGEHSGTGWRPRRQPCLRMMNWSHFGGHCSWTVEVGNMCSCDRLMVKSEGAQKQRTHTPRQENAHIDTLWEQGGAGTLEAWAQFSWFFCLPSLQDTGQWVYPKRCSEVMMLDLFTQICQSTVLQSQMCTVDSAWNNILSYRPSSTLSKLELFVANRTRGAIQTSARLALFF